MTIDNEDLSIPDTIEIRCSLHTLCNPFEFEALPHPASVPLLAQWTRRLHLHVYVDPEDTPFELDPLLFFDHLDSYTYPEC